MNENFTAADITNKSKVIKKIIHVLINGIFYFIIEYQACYYKIHWNLHTTFFIVQRNYYNHSEIKFITYRNINFRNTLKMNCKYDLGQEQVNRILMQCNRINCNDLLPEYLHDFLSIEG